MHLSDPHSGLMVTTGIVGAGLPIANGLALAAQMQGSGRVTVVNFGDGATSTGAFHEALTLASIWKLPVVFVCQNNQYAEYTALAEYTRSRSFAKKADGYEMPGIRVDGNDPVAVHAAAGEAIARARRGEGPTLIEAVCHRLQGHAFGSDDAHMDKPTLEAAKKSAPVGAFRARLLAEGVAAEAELVQLETSIRASGSGSESLRARMVTSSNGARAPTSSAPRASVGTQHSTTQTANDAILVRVPASSTEGMDRPEGSRREA
jgi:TPP-dependent pyruvate/acetoin dehydrogenase alpha subunit